MNEEKDSNSCQKEVNKKLKKSKISFKFSKKILNALSVSKNLIANKKSLLY